MSRAILLVDHGSRRAEANKQLEELGLSLERELAESTELAGRDGPLLVEVAHMEVAEPDIATAVATCLRRGARELLVVPCMLSRGRHVSEDVPRLLAAALADRPDVSFRVAPPLLEQPGFLALLGDAARRLAGG